MDKMKMGLFDYVERVGPLYGVEDVALIFYALIRMQRPKLFVELGTGSGSVALLGALAMRENGRGQVISIDDATQWPRLREREQVRAYGALEAAGFHAFMNGLAEKFEVRDHLTFLDHSFPPFPELDGEIDILFADYESQPAAIATILAHFLPRMSPAASVFIDGAATYLPSFLFLERLVDELNRGKVPASLLGANAELESLIRLVQTRKFTLVHLTEDKPRLQNSTTWLKIEPVDHQPHPLAAMR